MSENLMSSPATPEAQLTAKPPRFGNPVVVLVVAAVVLAGILLRVLGLQTSFWIDEIWSWQFAAHTDHWTDVFARFHHDNNHYLNTLWIWWCGPQPGWAIYRAPAMLGGVATLGVAAWAASKSGSTAVLFTLALVASSTLLTIYASEARGYALAGACALGLIGVLRADRFRLTWGWGLVFGLTAALGISSHLTFATTYGAAGLVMLIAVCLQPSLIRLGRLVWWHAIPVGLIAILWWFDLRKLEFGSPSPFPAWVVLGDVCATLFGDAGVHVLWTIAGILCHLATLGYLAWRWKNQPLDSLLLLLAIYLVPLTLALFKPQNMFIRYFYVPQTLWLLLAAEMLATWFQRSNTLITARNETWIRATAALLACALVATNLYHSREFVRLGRGNFPQLLQEVGRATRGRPVSIQVENGKKRFFELELLFYQPFLSTPPQFVIYEQSELPPAGTQYALFASVKAPNWPPARQFDDRHGNFYRMVYTDDHSRLVSWNWALYERQP